MNKSKLSMINAIFALIQMGAVSIIGLVIGRSILTYYGSDYNGVNSIVTQLVNVIMVLEGGFTLASNVALFKPFGEKNIEKINGILSATGKRFNTVSIIAIIIGTIIAIIFPLCITTQVPYATCVCLMLTVLLPSCFNLGYSMKYRVVLLANQREYVISAISTAFYIVGNCMAIIIIRAGHSILEARIAIMISLFLSYYMIGEYCKKKYNFISFKEKPRFQEIRGSRNVIALKITSMLYSSIPIILISTLPTAGAMLASVYAVYKNVISIVSSCLTSITNAPRLGFGALLAEDNLNAVEKMFNLYEKITFLGLSIILGTTCLLIMPFIELYTRGVNDVNYHNVLMACIMLATIYLEICHIPSGQIIQMSGAFEVSRNIQLIAFIVLIISMTIARWLIGLYGIIVSILLAALVLCILEIGYTGVKIFKRNWGKLILNIVPSFIICVITCIIGFSGRIHCDNYIIFVLEGLVSIIILSCISIVIYYLIDPDSIKKIFGMVKRFLERK